MNEDLHNIDQIFKNGIDGHLEDLPPEVWQGVSHDLDKKLAVQYRDKYYRLKRAAIFFLIFAFTTGAVALYFSLSKKGDAKSSTENISSTPASKSENSLPQNNKDNNFHKVEPPVVTANKNLPPRPDTKQITGSGDGEKFVTNGLEKSTTAHNDLRKNYTAIKNQIFLPKNNDVEKQERINSTSENSDLKTYTNRLLINEIKEDKKASNKEIVQKQNPSWLRSNPDKMIHAAYAINVPSFDLRQQSRERVNLVSSAGFRTSQPKIKSPHQFSLTAFFAPNISFDHLEDDKRLAGPGRNRDDARHEEQTPESFSVGLLVDYSLSKKISVRSGLIYTSSSTNISPKTIYAKADNNGHTSYELHCSSGYSYISPKDGTQPAVGDSVKTSNVTSKLSYVSIPIEASYIIQKGRLSLQPGLGAGINILTAGKTQTALIHGNGDETASAKISGLKSTYMDGRIGIGAAYELTKKISVSVKPTARIALTSINNNTPVKSFQNFLSIETGIRVKL